MRDVPYGRLHCISVLVKLSSHVFHKTLRVCFSIFQNINNNKKDEPTTGLDSTAATSIIDTLRNLATNYNKTIVAVIHQPTQTVFSSFDQLLLISNGKQL